MKKLGGILAVICGLLTLISAIVAILATHSVFSGEWVDKIRKTVDVSRGVLWASVVIAVLQIAIGIWSIKNSTGIASFILMIFFTIQFGLGIYHGIHMHSWPTTTIVVLTIQGIAAFGLLGSFIKGK